MINAFRRTTAFLASATVALTIGPFGGIANANPSLTAEDPIPLLPLPSLPLPAAPNAVDTEPPETAILIAPSNPSNDTTPSFTFGTDEPGTYECSVDGSPFFACSNPYEITPALADGNHTIAVRAIDASANVDPSPATYSWEVDTVAPESTIDSGPSDPTTDITPEFQFSSTDPSATFECRLWPSESWAPCVSPQARGPLSDGNYEFRVRATDAAGNTETSISRHAFRVDTTGPVVSIDSAPSDPSADASPSFSFSTSDASTPVGFSCTLDGGAAFACSSPTVVGPLADGSHTFTVSGTDSLGNAGSAASHTWTVDLTGPETSITSAPASPTNQTSASFSFTSPEPGATFECSLDGAAFASCTSPKSYSGLSAGSHDFQVRALDALGNADASPASHAWTIDLTAPETTITATPGAATNDPTPTFEFTSSEPGSTFQCSRNTGQPYIACSSPYTLDPAYADGSKVFRVRAIDAAGNIDASPAAHSFVVDQVAPTASFTSTPSSPTNSDPVSHSFTRSDDRSGVATTECAVDAGAFAACTSPVSTAGLSDGSHTLFVRVTDNAGNVRNISNTFTVDKTAPIVAITSGPSDPTSSTSATIQFTASDATSGIASTECSLDAGAFAACTSPESYSGLADGSHTVTVRATDAAGNPSTASHTWTVDASGPETTITTAPTDPTNADTAIFEFTADDAPVTFECSVDAAPFAACTSGDSFGPLADGSHDFLVRGIDDLGNPDPTPAAHTWVIDTVAPTTTFTLTPPDPDNQMSTSFEFTGDDIGGTGVASFECDSPASPGVFAACSSPHSYTAAASGSNTLQVRAIDAAGNIGAPASFSWFIDPDAPSATLTVVPTDPTADDTPTFEFTGSDPAPSPSGVAGFECSLDAAPFAACTSPLTTSSLVDGPHTFEVRAVDNAGNTGSAASTSFTVDTGAPETTITVAPADPESNPSPVFEFTSSESGSTFECSVDGAAFTACASGDTFGPLADGPHSFEVRATDVVGNTDGTPASHAWVVDTTAPTVTLDSTPADPTNATNASFAFSITDASATVAECVLDATFTNPACASPAIYSGPLSDGTHTFDLTVTDAAGNATSVSFSWLVDTIAPQMVTPFGGPPAYTNSTDADITFSATDAGSGVVSYECRHMPASFAACTSPFQLTGLADGAHQVRIRATDAAGNTGVARRHDWTVDTVDPETTLTSKPKHFCCEPGDTATFEFTVDGTGSPVADTECSVDGSAFASCSSPLELTGVSEGVHEFQIRSTDAAGNIETAISYQWTQGDPPETFLDSAPVTPSSSSEASFSFSSDRDPVGFRCLLQRIGGPQAYFQTCGSPKTYTGLTDGSYRFQVRAFDSLNNPDPTPAVYDFVIDRSAPVVTIDPVTSPTASDSVSFSFSADEPGATFACSMDGGSFEACASPKAYTGLADGSHTFQVRASDALGNTSSPVSASVVVDTTAPSATLTSGPAAETSSPVATFTFTGSDSGTGVASFECSLDAAAFAACTSPHSVSGLADGPHTFEVRAIDQVGNVGAAASHSWSIDATAPTVTIVKPTPGIYAADQRIGNSSTVQSFGDLTTQVTLADSSGIASVAFTADGAAVAHSCSGADCSALIESPGPNTMVAVVITVADTAGNTATATVQIHFLA